MIRCRTKVKKRFLLDDFSQVHQRNDAQRNQQIGPDGVGFQVDAADQEQDSHPGKPADQRTDCTVQPDTKRAFDFRLNANDRRDRRIERRAGADVEKQINQAADENRHRCLDDYDSHIPRSLVQ